MATIQDIVQRAFQKIAVQSNDETVTGYDLTAGVTAYNMMVHGFKLKGADFEHTDQVGADVFAYGDEFQEGMVYLLASRLSPDYVAPPMFNADDWLRNFQASKMAIEAVIFDNAMTLLPSRRAKYGYTIDTD